MKFSLATFQSSEGLRVGLVLGNRLLEINRTLSIVSKREAAFSKEFPAITSMTDLLEAWDGFFPALSYAAKFFSLHPGEMRGATEIDKAHILAPVLNPGKIINTGLNSYDHAREMGVELPSQGFQPNFFLKGDQSCVIGPGQSIRLSSGFVDWEAELAVVIGKRAKDIKPSEAFNHIAGYTCHNDVTDRRLLIKKDGSIDFFRGKVRDTFCPLGPFLVPKEFVSSPKDLPIRCLLNDEVMQDSTTGQYFWGPEECVSYLSTCVTLMPGDVIALGTVAGTGWAHGIQGPRDLQKVIHHMSHGGGRFMRPGDRIVVEISDIGRLENHVEEA